MSRDILWLGFSVLLDGTILYGAGSSSESAAYRKLKARIDQPYLVDTHEHLISEDAVVLAGKFLRTNAVSLYRLPLR